MFLTKTSVLHLVEAAKMASFRFFALDEFMLLPFSHLLLLFYFSL